MNNTETKENKNAGPEIMIGSEAKLIYLEGEHFNPAGITLYRMDDGARQEITAQELVNQGNVYPTTALTGEVTDILFTWDGDETYLPIVVKKVYGENSAPATKSLSLTKSVNATWFPATGEMATTFTDVIFDKTPLNFALKHVHINNNGLYSCGRSWKLNLHKKITNETNGTIAAPNFAEMTANDYVYVDEFGKEYKFKEIYFYIDENGNKQLCKREDVKIDTFGTLTYTKTKDNKPEETYFVSREFATSTGLKLEAEFKGIKGVELLEQRNEDVAALETEIEKLKALIAEGKTEYKITLSQYQEKLSKLKLQIPVVYLVDSTQTAMGFNHRGDLCVIGDSYGNAISVEWGKIYISGYEHITVTGIYEGDFYTKFNYDFNELITSIVTSDGKEIKYEYSSANNSRLTKVTYPDGKVLNFDYDNTLGTGKYVTQVIQSNGQKTQISYNCYKPQYITTYSCFGTITDGSTLSQQYQEVEKLTLRNKTTTSMPSIEQDGLTQTIFVNEHGAEIGGFAQRESQVYETPLTFAYCDKQNKWGYNITEHREEAVLFDDITDSSRTLEDIDVTPLKTKYSEFVFSALVKANGTQLPNHKKSFGLSAMEQKDTKNFSFGLSATLIDANGNQDETFWASASGNHNFAQVVALPITIKPTTEKVRLSVVCNSTSENATFKNLRFVPCSWQYNTYDDFGNVVDTITSKKATGFDGNVTQYAHSKTHNSYNKQNKLVRTTQRTFVNDIPFYTTVSEYQYCNHGNVVREETYTKGKQATDGINVIERVCDENGNVVKEIFYNSLDSSSKFYSESNFDETGKVLCQVDETGENKTILVYKDGTTQVQAQVLPNGSTFAYGTDESGNTTSITHSTSLGEENSTNTHYTHDLPTKVTSGNNVVDYTYDYKGRVTNVAVNGEQTTYTYQENETLNGKKCDKTTVVSRGVTATAYVDKQGKTIKTELQETGNDTTKQTVDYSYDTTGKLLTKGNVSYTYDNLDRLVSVQKDGATTESYTYDKLGRVSSKTVDGNTYTYAYKDNISSKVQSLALPNGAVMQPLVDVNGRNKGKEVLVSGNKVMAEHISYRKVGDHATNQPSAIYFGDKANGEFAIKGNLKYKYDEMGNITHVFQDGILVVTYAYDKLGRILREDNKKLGKTYLYSYDNCGNMLSKRIANYTTKPAEEIEFSEETLYFHVGDRLVAVNDQVLLYDEYGRLTDYNNKKFSWQSNRLASVNGVVITYDVFGRRTSKGETTFTYDSSNNLLTAGALSFFYDTHGIAGFAYEGETYYYRKNIQGDVIALLDSTGAVVATYTYDAWGNCVVATDTNGIGEINPIRYRSYYWDSEFGLYFLQSRYYSPELCRFISQDSIEYLDPKSINGLNLYAYCSNDPINLCDPTGHDAILFTDYDWDNGGLFIVGHSVLFIKDEYGVWWITEYTGTFPDKSSATVRCEVAEQADWERFEKQKGFWNTIKRGLRISGNSKVYLEGNYSSSLSEAKKLKDTDFGGYNFLTNNCLHYVKTILRKTVIDSVTNKYFKNSTTIIPAVFTDRASVCVAIDYINDEIKKIIGFIKGVFN